MGIQNFPAALQPIIQQNFLEREFQDGLQAKLGFRAIADREKFAIRIGETVTKTRRGLKAPVTTPIVPSANVNLDNSMTAAGWTVEQYVLALNMYGDTMDLNMVTEKVGIASQFLQNAKVNGIQAAASLDLLARNALFSAYLGGNTRVTVTLGSAGTTVSVDDIRGFGFVMNNGVLVPVSGGNPLTVTIGADVYSVVGVTPDGSNVSTAPGGISGTLTLSSSVTVLDGTINNAVISGVAPLVVRPNNRATTEALVSGDYLLIDNILSGIAALRSNNVPPVESSGLYHCHLDDQQLLGLFKDDDFKLLYRGQYGSDTYRKGQIIDLLGVRFVPVNTAPQQASLGAGAIHRAIICGQGAIVEGNFDATGYSDVDQPDALKVMVDDVCMVTREPIDRLQQIIAQSWYWIGGYAVPSDVTANANVIPTATNSLYKRGVVIESL